jgi:hypothetical protein
MRLLTQHQTDDVATGDIACDCGQSSSDQVATSDIASGTANPK